MVVKRCDWETSSMQEIIQALSEHIEEDNEELLILPKKRCLQSIINTLLAASIPYQMHLAGRMHG